MGTNIPDFTRYLKKTKPVYYQGLFVPLIGSKLGIFGIIGTSCSKVMYGIYIWDPLEIAAQWNSPAGRAGTFFVGCSWVIAQIGTNISANVISCSNDMTNLCPKYINIRRGTILTTIIAGWTMVPWKIIHSASNLLTFMGALAIFLAPIAAIMAADYWVVRQGAVDVPALFQTHERYRYEAGFNWRAAVAMAVSLAPNLPGEFEQSQEWKETNSFRNGSSNKFEHQHWRSFPRVRHKLFLRILCRFRGVCCSQLPSPCSWDDGEEDDPRRGRVLRG